MSKHTPGPWQTLEVGEFTTKLAVADSQGVSVLTVVDEEGTKFGAVYGEADADLIAAAPDLLLALRMLYDETADYIRLNNLGGMDNQCMQLARAALAKAVGDA